MSHSSISLPGEVNERDTSESKEGCMALVKPDCIDAAQRPLFYSDPLLAYKRNIALSGLALQLFGALLGNL